MYLLIHEDGSLEQLTEPAAEDFESVECDILQIVRYHNEKQRFQRAEVIREEEEESDEPQEGELTVDWVSV